MLLGVDALCLSSDLVKQPDGVIVEELNDAYVKQMDNHQPSHKSFGSGYTYCQGGKV